MSIAKKKDKGKIHMKNRHTYYSKKLEKLENH